MAVPSWKQAILDKRRKQEEEEQRRIKDEEAKLSAIPAWKRSILRRKDGNKAPGPGLSVSRVPFGLKTSGAKSVEKTPADSRPRPHSESTNLAKRSEETQKVEGRINEQPILKPTRWTKTANGSVAVEKKPSGATTPPWSKVTLRKTVSNESAPSKVSPTSQIKRWPVVQPPNVLARSASSPRNVKREVDVAVGVSKVTQSRDSPTIPQRKEAFQMQVTTTTSSSSKHRNVKKTALDSDKLPVEALQAAGVRPAPLKRGSVKSLMGFFQGESKLSAISKAAPSSPISGSVGSVSSEVMVSKCKEQGDLGRKSVSNKAELTVSNVPQTTTFPTSLDLEENSKMDKAVSASDNSTPSASVQTTAVLKRPEECALKTKPSEEAVALKEELGEKQMPFEEVVAVKEEPAEKPFASEKAVGLKEEPALQTSTTVIVNHTEESLQTSNADAELSAIFISVHDQDVHQVEKEQSTGVLVHTSNGSLTQWEEEDYEEELTVTSIDDLDTTDEENEQPQKTQLAPSERNDQLTRTDDSCPLESTPIKATPASRTDPEIPFIALLNVHRDERRSSATLEPTKQADVSDVIRDALPDIEQGSAQNTDSKPIPMRKKSSLASKNKQQVC
jgi:hypothetical protein